MNLKKNTFTKANLWGISVFVILLLFTQFLSYQRYQIFISSEKNEISTAAINTRERIQNIFFQNVSATKTLAFIVQKYGEPHDFDSIAQSILENNNNVDVLQLVKGGTITKVFPLKGNESVLGYNILKDSLRNKEALKAIEIREMYFSGPFELKQGGMGIVGRFPIFINNEFWGFSACILKLNTLIKTANLINSDSNYFNYQLSKLSPNTDKEEFFLKKYKNFNLKNSVKIKLLYSDLNLSVMKNKSKTVNLSFMFIALGLALSILGGIFTWYIVKKPEELSLLVKQKNNELFESEYRYRTALSRVSDAFVSLDKKWCYTYMNHKAGNIFNRNPSEMIGKHIWTEFPEGIGQPFHLTYEKAMVEQKYQYLEEYYQPYDKWFENHIYPSDDGLSIYFRDITDKKKNEEKIAKSEKQFRSLFEQSADTIKILSSDFKHLDINISGCLLTGYTKEEFLQIKPSDLYFEEDIPAHEKMVKILLQDKSITRETRIKRKDGTAVEVEAMAKVLEDGRIVTIIHDLTTRKKYERQILKINEDLKALSAYLQQVREEERIHIAREIHDELGQLLTGIKMSLSWLKAKTTNYNITEIDKKIAELYEMIDNSIITVRKIAKELRPGVLDNLGLEAAIEWQSNDFAEKTKIKVNFKTELGEANCDDKINTAIFRIYQETLTNIVRHANAKNINTKLYISPKNNIVLEVADDGIGIDFTKQKKISFGLLGMKERAENLNGNFIIEKNINGGTIVKVNIPLKQ